MSDVLSDILTSVQRITGLSDDAATDNADATEAVKNNNAAMDASYTASAARAAAVAAQTGIVAATKNQGQLTAQTALQGYAHALGVDADGNLSSQQFKAQATFLDASQRAADAAATISQKRSVSFFDDPLQWLTNKVTINDDINTYNGAAGEANTAEQFIQESNQLIDARAVALNNIKTVTSQAATEAATNIVVEQQQELADGLRRAGIAANTQGVEAVANMSYRAIQIANAKLDSQAKYVQMVDDQKRLQLAQESHNLEAARFALTKATDEDKLGADQYMSGQLRKGLQLMFPGNPAAWDIPDGKYKAMISGKTPLDPIWKTAFDRAQASDIAGGVRVLGTSPADAINTLQFRPTIAPSAQPTVDLLTRAATAASKLPAYQAAVAAKDLKAVQDVINDTVNRMVASDASHVDSPTSLYYLPPVDEIVKMNPGLQDSAVYQAVIAPAVKAGISVDTPDQVAALAQKAVAAGTITLNDAADGISNIYAQGQLHNFQAKQLFSLGIVAPPSYVAPASGQSAMGLKAPIDWTSKLSVRENMMRRSSTNSLTLDTYSPI